MGCGVFIVLYLHFLLQTKGKGKTTEHLSTTSQVDVRKTRDLERALEKAKNENLQLHLQLQKARDEVTNLRAERKSLISYFF